MSQENINFYDTPALIEKLSAQQKIDALKLEQNNLLDLQMNLRRQGKEAGDEYKTASLRVMELEELLTKAKKDLSTKYDVWKGYEGGAHKGAR